MFIQEILDKYLSYQSMLHSLPRLRQISPKILDEIVEDLQKIQNLLDKLDIKCD